MYESISLIQNMKHSNTAFAQNADAAMCAPDQREAASHPNQSQALTAKSPELVQPFPVLTVPRQRSPPVFS